MFEVYGIYDPKTGDEYVGSAKQNAEVRRRCHLRLCKKGSHHAPKLQARYDNGVKLKFRILEEVDPKKCFKDSSLLLDREQFYINTVRGELLNASRVARSPLLDPAIAKRVAEANTGKKRSLTSRRCMSRAMKGKKKSLVHRDSMSRSRIGRRLSESCKRNISCSLMGHQVTARTRRKISIGKKGKSFSTEHLTNLSKAQKKRFAKARRLRGTPPWEKEGMSRWKWYYLGNRLS